MADNSGNGDSQWSTERFHDWLEQTAKNEDRTKQEVLHRMMASFWVLTEFEDLVSGDTHPQLQDLEQELDLATDDTENPWSMLPDQAPSTPQDTPSDDGDSPGIRSLIEGFATYLDEHSPPTADPTQPTPDQPSQTPHQQPPGVDSTHQDAGVPTRVEELEHDLGSVQDHIEQVAENLDDVVERQSTLTERMDELDDAHAGLDERVESDMEKVEQILKRLTEKYTDTDASLDQVESSLVSVLEERRTMQRQRERLASLLQTAHAHGIETGDCEDCGSTIRLGLLTTPRCPHCSKPLVDIRPGGWFRADSIETGESRHDPQPASRHRSTQARTEHRQPPARTRSPHDRPGMNHDPPVSDQQSSPPQDPPSTSEDDLEMTLESDDEDDESSSFEWADE